MDRKFAEEVIEKAVCAGHDAIAGDGTVDALVISVIRAFLEAVPKTYAQVDIYGTCIYGFDVDPWLTLLQETEAEDG